MEIDVVQFEVDTAPVTGTRTGMEAEPTGFEFVKGPVIYD